MKKYLKNIFLKEFITGHKVAFKACVTGRRPLLLA